MIRSALILLASAVLGGCAAGDVRDAAADAVTQDPSMVDAKFPPAMHEVSFRSGGSKLNGLVYIANGEGPHPTIVLLHGYAGNERNLDIAQALRRAGTNVVYFNYRGAWGSGGTLTSTHALEDVARVVETIRSPEWSSKHRADPSRVALLGHSFGGFLGAISTSRDAGIRCYAHLAGADFGAMGPRLRQDAAFRKAVTAELAMDIDADGGPIRGDAEEIIRDIESHADAYSLATLAPTLATRPLLLVAGTRDAAVPKAENHDPFVAALRAAGAIRLTEIVYDDDHGFSAHRIDLARRIVEWQRDECWQ